MTLPEGMNEDIATVITKLSTIDRKRWDTWSLRWKFVFIDCNISTGYGLQQLNQRMYAMARQDNPGVYLGTPQSNKVVIQALQNYLNHCPARNKEELGLYDALRAYELHLMKQGLWGRL